MYAIRSYYAHLLRNINALAESSGPDRRIGRKLLLCIDLVFRTRQRFEDGALTRSRYLRRMHRVRQRWHQLLEQASRECLIKRYRNRCARLLRESPQCWTFLEHDGVPLTNNEAERVLRGYVLWRKGSYGVCSHRGEQFRQRVLSLVETARKLKLNPLAWAREIALACIEKTPYPIPDALIFYVITSYSIHYTKLYELIFVNLSIPRGNGILNGALLPSFSWPYIDRASLVSPITRNNFG